MNNEQKIDKIRDMINKGEIILVAIEVVTAYKVVDYKIDENIGLPVFTKLEAIIKPDNATNNVDSLYRHIHHHTGRDIRQ